LPRSSSVATLGDGAIRVAPISVHPVTVITPLAGTGIPVTTHRGDARYTPVVIVTIPVVTLLAVVCNPIAAVLLHAIGTTSITVIKVAIIALLA
jgi:hypothetical protein